MSKQNHAKLALDVGAFVAFLIAMDPRSSGIALHEWLTIALAGTILVHLLLSWNWIAEITKRVFSKAGRNARANYILNWALFIDGVLIILSGIMISKSFVPFFGYVAPDNFAWRGLHSATTNLSMLLISMHVALHWSWIKSTVKRLFAGKESRVPQASFSMDRKDAQA